MAVGKQVVNVYQRITGDVTRYEVYSLKNRISPQVGKVISEQDVKDLIEQSVDVNIKRR